MVEAVNLTSLLQLGVGLGIGLSFFKATLNRKEASFSTRLARVHEALSAPADPATRQLATKAADLRARFVRGLAVAKKIAFTSQVAALVGAAVNVGLLIIACVNPNDEWSSVAPVFWSVGYFAALLLGVEFVLFLQFCRIDADLEVTERDAGVWNNR